MRYVNDVVMIGVITVTSLFRVNNTNEKQNSVVINTSPMQPATEHIARCGGSWILVQLQRKTKFNNTHLTLVLPLTVIPLTTPPEMQVEFERTPDSRQEEEQSEAVLS